MERKPNGFWTKDEVVRKLLAAHVLGKANLDKTTDALMEYCEELQITQPREVIKADVVWYARSARKALGLPSAREIKQSAAAQADIRAQAE